MGATALEFALILPILLLLIFGITEYGMVVYGNATLEAAVDVAAREGKTGFTCGGSQTAYIQGLVNNIIGGLLNTNNLQVYAVPFTSWNINPTCTTNTANECSTAQPPSTDPNDPECPSPGRLPLCGFDLGSQGKIVEYTFVYPWAIIPPFLSNVIGSGGNASSNSWGTVNLTASAVVQNEPSNTEAITTTNRNNAACP